MDLSREEVGASGWGRRDVWCASAVAPIGFQIVSEKFYTVDDFNSHITKCRFPRIKW
jgi:hypothetical protein